MDTLSNPRDSSVTTLYLARHGQSEWNNQSRVTGQLDPGLSPKGQQQSEAIAQCLSDENIAAIYKGAFAMNAIRKLKRCGRNGKPICGAARCPAPNDSMIYPIVSAMLCKTFCA
jgi:Histidine phosphatase superfamily (branch 1)